MGGAEPVWSSVEGRANGTGENGLQVRLALVAGLCLLARTVSAAAPAPFSPHQIEFFETKVRPILAGTCQKCHGVEKQKGGLRLDSRESAFKGGESGAAVVPGNPAESPMIDAVNYRGLEMPPTGKLNPREIAALGGMGQNGCSLAEGAAVGLGFAAKRVHDHGRGPALLGFSARRKSAAFPRSAAPIGSPTRSTRSCWLDWKQKGLAPNPPADPRTLIRRLFFDLIGLPPTPEEIDAFVADHSPRAYERLVDDLLSRKQYGERWGRHWLDVTRFAQTNGYERDAEKPEAWRYRDYVIPPSTTTSRMTVSSSSSLPATSCRIRRIESIIATGFYRLGIWDDEPDNQKAAAWDEIDEMVRTTGSTFLGLTLGCARCHNHMFDPIPQEDYYRFAAFFRNVEPYGIPVSATHMAANNEGIFTPLTSPQEYAAWQARQTDLSRRLRETKDKLKALRKAVTARLRTSRKASSPPPTSVEVGQNLTTAERAEKARINAESSVSKTLCERVPFPRALSVRECGLPLKETRVLIRGNVATPGKRVEPRLLTVLGGRKIEAAPVSFQQLTSSG